MSKLTMEAFGSLAKARDRKKEIVIDLGDQTFNVKIIEVFTVEYRIKMAEILEKIFSQTIGKDLPSVNLSLLTVLKTITDIDFSDDLEKGLDFLYLLSDLGIVKKIFNEIPPEVMMRVAETMDEFAKVVIDLKEQEEKVE